MNRWWPSTVHQMGEGWNSSVGASCDDDVVDSSAEASLRIRVQGQDVFACVSLQLPPWFYVSAQSSPVLEKCPPPVQANPHPGPLDSGSDISYREVMKTWSWEQKMKDNGGEKPTRNAYYYWTKGTCQLFYTTGPVNYSSSQVKKAFKHFISLALLDRLRLTRLTWKMFIFTKHNLYNWVKMHNPVCLNLNYFEYQTWLCTPSYGDRNLQPAMYQPACLLYHLFFPLL